MLIEFANKILVPSHEEPLQKFVIQTTALIIHDVHKLHTTDCNTNFKHTVWWSGQHRLLYSSRLDQLPTRQ